MVALQSIIPQIDRLFIFLDKYDSIPQFLPASEKIVPLLPAQHGQLGGDGKFVGARLFASPCLYFCFDDDIRYPFGYVELLASGLERHYFRALVGLHASRFIAPHLSYYRDRRILHFSSPLGLDTLADEIGTGTLAFHSGHFPIDPSMWRFHTMADLMVGVEGVRRGMARIAIRRPKDFVTSLERDQLDSLHYQVATDDSRETAIMQSVLRNFPASWTPMVNCLNG